MLPLHERLKHLLPRLTADNYRETSPASWSYNCIAWAGGLTDSWWWPAPGRYWPPNVPRHETVGAFLAPLATLGYGPIATLDLDPGLEKVVLYANGEIPSHAARQPFSGMWSSKLGPSLDIEHNTPEAVAGGVYGEVVAILGRTRQP